MNDFAKRILILIFSFLPLTVICQSNKKAEKAYDEAVRFYFDENQSDKAMQQLERALSADPDFALAWWLKGDILLKSGDYEQALSAYEKVKSLQPNANIAASIDLARFRLQAVQNPVPFEPINLGAVNTANDEYINMVLYDNSELLLTRRMRSEQGIPQDESLYHAYWKEGAWQEARPFVLPYLQSQRIGAACCSPDGKTLYFSYHDGDKHSSRDIFVTHDANGEWSAPVALTTVNTSAWESQPCLSADGKELFFTRRVKGHAQIFTCTRESVDAAWSQPVRLDSVINVKEGNQMAPFLHPDGKTLFFASDKLVGMGGFDLFMSRRANDGTWTTPVNIGYPINTAQDEINLYVAPNGKTAFISSQREGGQGGYDIYSFELDETLRPEAVTYFAGEIVQLDVYPEKINMGDTLTVRNIQFEFNSAALTADSRDGIDKLAEWLNAHPEWKVELAGHTDNVGSDSYNQKLSADRAFAVRDALINKGVSAQRLSAKGYGSAKPIVPNDSEANQAMNRRVEMIIRGKTTN